MAAKKNWCHPKVLSGTNCSLKCRSPPYEANLNNILGVMESTHGGLRWGRENVCVCVFLGTTGVRV